MFNDRRHYTIKYISFCAYAYVGVRTSACTSLRFQFFKMAGQELPTTGAASSRRTRRRLLADAFERGTRTFGDAEDPDRLDAFLARGRAVGGQARRDAEARASVVLGLPWPVTRSQYPPEVFSALAALCAEYGIVPQLRENRDGVPYLTLRATRVESEDTEQAEANVQHAFWAFFEQTASWFPLEQLERLVVPRAWAPKLHEPPEGLSFFAGGFEVDDRSSGSYTPAEGRGIFALLVSEYVGYVAPQQLCGQQELTRMLQESFDVNHQNFIITSFLFFRAPSEAGS